MVDDDGAAHMVISLAGWVIFGICNERRTRLLRAATLVHNAGGRAGLVFGRGAGVGCALLCPSSRLAMYRMRPGRRSRLPIAIGHIYTVYIRSGLHRARAPRQGRKDPAGCVSFLNFIVGQLERRGVSEIGRLPFYGFLFQVACYIQASRSGSAVEFLGLLLRTVFAYRVSRTIESAPL